MLRFVGKAAAEVENGSEGTVAVFNCYYGVLIAR